MRLQGRGAMEEGSDDRSGGFGGCCHCWRNSLWLIHQDAVEAGGAPTGGGVNPSTDGGSCCGGGSEIEEHVKVKRRGSLQCTSQAPPTELRGTSQVSG